MNRLSRFFGRLRAASTFLEDFVSGELLLDPLEEDPHYILTTSERASIRARRDTIADPLIRSDVTQLLSAVEQLGDYRKDEHEVTTHFDPEPKSVLDWLKEPWSEVLPWPADMNPLALVTDKPTRLDVYAALVGMNGGTTMKEFGNLSAGGPYGRTGITVDEMVVLTWIGAFVDGWATARGEEISITSLLAGEIQRASLKRIEAMHPPVKTMRVTATELYVNGEKVADVTDVHLRPRSS